MLPLELAGGVCPACSSGKISTEALELIMHELKHCVEHISDYYGVNPKSERAAYLQGEIAKKMFPAVAIAVCPRCHDEREEE